MSFRFIGRQKDIEYLNKKYVTDSFQFIIIHGRRRVGKTELIKKFISDKKGLYFVADTEPEKTLLNRMYESISYQIEGRRLTFADIDAFFEYIYDISLTERYILVLDEFQYIMEAMPSFTSVLQRYIDESLRGGKLFLILCGSEIRIMQSLFAIQNPLHGRRTGHWKVEPFRFSELSLFFQDDVNELIMIYSLLGGIPLYLNHYSIDLSFEDNIVELLLDRGSLLVDEPINLLRSEFREISRYFGIIQAIARGKNRIVEISNSTGIEARTLPRYITNLIETDLIEKYIPVGVNTSSNKLSRYRVRDNMMNFWFRFIQPNQNQIQLGDTKQVLKHIKDQYHSYMGIIFENIVKQLIEELNSRELLPLELIQIGTWWKKDIEFDILGISLSGNEIICIEVKYGKNVNGDMELQKIEDKLQRSMWQSKIKYIAVVARGFNKKCEGCIDLNTLWSNYTDGRKLDMKLVE